jgi:cysteine-rich repeat protein
VDGAGNVYVAGSGSNNAFRIQFCGDGLGDPGEQCDDDNTYDGDGCSAQCLIEFCGDGVLQPGLGEQCDDGNSAEGDGCSSACHVELQPQNKDQQKCINALNKNFAKVAKAQSKEIYTCIKDAARARLAGTIEQCLTADRRRKVARAKSQTSSDEAKYCSRILPDYGCTDSATVNAVAEQKGLDLVHDIFGPNLDTVIASGSLDRHVAKCQQAVAKSVQKCQHAKLKELNQCVENGLEDQTIGNYLQLQTGRIRSTIEEKCDGVDFASAFPGLVLRSGCSTSLAGGVAWCLDDIVNCRFCKALNEADALARDCDEFDDGAVNGSCPVPDGPAPGPVVLYDRLDPSLTTPFPDDFWTVVDTATRTGLRVELDVPDREDDVASGSRSHLI